MNLLKQALMIAKEAHGGQVDKAGAPYINHPLRVAALVKTDEEKIVALLHDVIEDSEYTPQDLIDEGIPREIVEVVVLMTKDKQTGYEDYLKDVKRNPIARKVKIADLTHNMDISRIKSPCSRDHERIDKYKKAFQYLSVSTQ